MILARYHGTKVEIVEAINGQALIRTADGRKIFTARVARSDPEEAPAHEFVVVDWKWVSRDDLSEIAVVQGAIQIPARLYQAFHFGIFLVKNQVQAVRDYSKKIKDLARQVLSCPHLHTVIDTSGGYHFSGGEAWDDIKERVLCLDCGQEIPSKQTGTATSQEIPF